MSITKTKFLLIFLAGFFVLILISAFLIKPKIQSQSQFTVKPNPNNSQTINLKDPVILNFNKPFNLSELVIDVEPTTPINIDSDSTSTTLIITPAQSWRMRKNYSIRILKKSVSISGETLKDDFTYQFQTSDHL